MQIYFTFELYQFLFLNFKFLLAKDVGHVYNTRGLGENSITATNNPHKWVL